MNIDSNYHSHSHFDDGQEAPEAYARAAVEKGLHSLGFSGHIPVPFSSDWNMRQKDLPDYIRIVQKLRERYRDKLDIFLGLEVDYIPNVLTPVGPQVVNLELDFTIGAVHFLGTLPDGRDWTVDGPKEEFEQGLLRSFSGDIRSLIEEYYQRMATMIRFYPPDIVGHFDVVKKNNEGNQFFSEEALWYRHLVLRTLDALAQSNCILEVNTGGISRGICSDYYPSQWILERCLELNIPITLGSDAHKPQDLDAYFAEANDMLKEIGFKHYQQLTREGWVQKFLP